MDPDLISKVSKLLKDATEQLAEVHTSYTAQEYKRCSEVALKLEATVSSLSANTYLLKRQTKHG